MVWALTPVGTERGAQKYYISAAGTYTVGRKDCDIVQTETSISRVHAEIAVEKMVAWEPRSGAPASPSCVSVVDRSKYGTFVNKVQGTQGSRLRKDEVVVLSDGDTVTFGNGNMTFRFSFIPIVVFFHGKKSARIDRSLQAVMTSIGAYVTRKWIDTCTHVLVDESSPLTPELLDAIITKKPIILGNWFKAMAEKNIHTEIPSCTQYIPNLTLDGMDIKMVENKLMENCLAGHTFILGSSEKYKFGEKIQELLESTGAKYLSIEEFCANSQDSGAGDNDQQILLVPAKSPLEFSKMRPLFPLSKTTDVKLFAAILSGRLEAAAIEPPAYMIASSNTTDETIVADSDVETDTAISDHTVAASKSQHHILHMSDDKAESKVTSSVSAVNLEETNVSINIQNDLEKEEISEPMEEDVQVIEKTTISGFKAGGEHVRVINKVVQDEACDAVFVNKAPKDENLDSSREETCHVIFSQDLIVKRVLRPAPTVSTETGGVNFKRFKKRQTVSGNSFKALIPCAQEPYRESDYEKGTLNDFMREEKRRKQMESIAEDLFNNQKPQKKKAAAGSSIQTLLTGCR
ncbi:nibrin homolog [Aegilops tauschii subsp. strangulata]|uniref:FHA domain-containing protein n=4 Tax=Aegilops tauschii TaxID=37682 RepID=A0A452YHD6_AEGTS|nr:nijmegen breakage syndrome 1 protein [Aegilops tauschii subsp. strangulata]ACB56931.1 NBS1 [Aegilops tauschii]ACB56932.1 NBS1 [Aegilops tauschii]